MVLAEIIIEKNNLEKKIKQLETYLFKVVDISAEQTNVATEKLLGLIDKHRSHLIMINKINNSIEVTIGGSKVNLASAVLIANTMKQKVDLVDRLIDKYQYYKNLVQDLIDKCDEDAVLDIFNLIEQRDKLLEEYTLISNTLKSIEWSTKVD